MTQLIGIICEDGKTVVTVSDRMVSTGDMTLAFEHPHIKAVQISKKAIVLTAGTVHEPDLIRQAKEKAKRCERILEMADALKDAFQEIREQHIVDEILRPRVGIRSLAEWRAEQRQLHDRTVMDISEGISSYQLRLSLLLAGIDREGHLIVVGDPGTYRSFDNLSYCCLGMGDRHADNVFAWYKYSRLSCLKKALYIAFEAKKRAEMAGGVGQATDILIIDNDGVKEVSIETVAILEEVYRDRETVSEKAWFDERITDVVIRTRNLEIPLD